MGLRTLILILFLALVLVLVEFVAATDLVQDEDGLSGPADYEALAKRFKWRRCRRSSDCGDGFYCRWNWCYPRQMCTSNRQCSIDKYCDTEDRVCKTGQRSCQSDKNCQSYYLYCKDKVCVKKECFHHYQCPSGQICQRPGVCAKYVQTCKTHRQCRVSGYICIDGMCKQRQCYRHYQCSFGYRCKWPGLCQLRRGYCLDKSDCYQNQCCMKKYNIKVGLCYKLQRPGYWCDAKEKYSCPCVEGYTCQQNSGYWGTCVKAPPTSPPPTSPPQPTTVEPTEEPGSGGSGEMEY